jgi:hypothetical protein
LGPLHMPLFVNSDELFGLRERWEDYWLGEKFSTLQLHTGVVKWRLEVAEAQQALCKVSQLLYCKTQIFARCSHVTSSLNCPTVSPPTAIAAGRGFRPLRKHFLGPPARENQQKKFYTKSERLTVSCSVTWGWSERADLYSRHIMILPRKTITYAT